MHDAVVGIVEIHYYYDRPSTMLNMKSKIRLIFGAILICISLPLVSGDVELCFPTFIKIDGIYSIDGIPMNSSTLEICMKECEDDSSCLAFDYDLNDVSVCRMQTDVHFENIDRIYNNSDKSQFRINRNCQVTKVALTDCSPSWRIMANLQSTIAPRERLNVSHTACLTLCRFLDSCHGIVYDSNLWPPCLVFDDYEFASSNNVRSRDNSEINKIEKKNCPNVKRSIGRCAGQSFPPSGTWCPFGTELTVIGAYYRVHPFCCPNLADPRIPPLDSRDLLSLDVSYVDPVYSATIDVCLSNASCSLKAISFASAFSVRYFLSESDIYYVAVEFKCDPPQLEASNRTALVLGAIGLTLGLLCFFIIASLLLYVCYIKKCKAWLSEKQNAKTRTTSTFNPFFTVDGSSLRIVKIDVDRPGSTSSSKDV